jgi:hypothetical protein
MNPANPLYDSDSETLTFFCSGARFTPENTLRKYILTCSVALLPGNIVDHL